MRPNVFWIGYLSMKKLLKKENKNLEMFSKLKPPRRNGKCFEKQPFVIYAVSNLLPILKSIEKFWITIMSQDK